MWKWIYYNSPTVQATCASVGLIGLLLYVVDTHLIRKAAINQTKAVLRPFFVLDFAPGFGENIFEIKNVGQGIALGTIWSFRNPMWPTEPHPVGAVASGYKRTLRDSGSNIHMELLVAYGGLRITYTDTAGNPYWTEIDCSDVDGMLMFHVETGEIEK